jgi:aminocarboxymuconate-semialdehyde decarboxylase
MMGYLDTPAMAWSLGGPFEDIVAIYNLVASGLPERFPQISWVVPHCCGAFAALSGRIDEIWDLNPDPHQPLTPSEYVRSHKISVDSASPQTSRLALARDLFGAEHLLLGSDFPYLNRSDLTASLQPIHALNWPGEGKEQLLARNAGSLFHLV